MLTLPQSWLAPAAGAVFALGAACRALMGPSARRRLQEGALRVVTLVAGH